MKNKKITVRHGGFEMIPAEKKPQSASPRAEKKTAKRDLRVKGG